MSKKPLKMESLWDIPAAVMTLLLGIHFTAVAALCFAAIGMVFLEPAVAVVTAMLLLLGIVCHFVTRHKTSRLWRRLLLGAIGANFLLVACFVAVVCMMIMAWTNIGGA